jgi:hypothetical protein
MYIIIDGILKLIAHNIKIILYKWTLNKCNYMWNKFILSLITTLFYLWSQLYSIFYTNQKVLVNPFRFYSCYDVWKLSVHLNRKKCKYSITNQEPLSFQSCYIILFVNTGSYTKQTFNQPNKKQISRRKLLIW